MMRKHQRRRLLPWLALALAVGGAAPAWAQVPAGAKGCSLQGLGPEAVGDMQSRIRRSSGNAALDADMAAVLNQLTGRFGALPRFYFLDDTGAPNAYFDSRRYGADDDFPPDRNEFGTIVVGLNLIDDETRTLVQGAAILPLTAILAHELGHTLQFRKGNNEQRTVIKELQADFLAGWAVRSLQRTVAPQLDEAKAFSSIYNKGANDFNSPQHHGTKVERLAAFLAGFDVEDDDVNVAYAKALAYVREHPPVTPPGGPNNGLTFAGNLGIHYERLPNNDGTFAARIARPPEPASPAALGGLEAGDIILMLDGMPFRTEEDVLHHVDRTTVTLIDVRTNAQQEAVIQIPPPPPGPGQ